MSAKAPQVPNAWDEDWEAIADKEEEQTAPEPGPEPETQPPSSEKEPEKKVSTRVSKAQRRAQHAEFNRQLWAEAEAEQALHFLQSRSAAVPFKSDYKPPVKVLSRNPQIARRASPSSLGAAVEGLNLGSPYDNGEDEDSDDPDGKKTRQLTAEERQAIALREREEKQRKYEEVRERLFGTTSAAGSGTSSPGTTTPPAQRRGKNNRQNGRGDSTHNSRERRTSPPTSTGSRQRQLYDPGYTAKPKRDKKQLQRTNSTPGSGGANSKTNDTDDDPQPRQQVPIRNPRGPDGSGRGGHGFSQNAGRGR